MKILLFLILVVVAITTHAQGFGPWKKVNDSWQSSFSYCTETHASSGVWHSGYVTDFKLRNDATVKLIFDLVITYESGQKTIRENTFEPGRTYDWLLDTKLVTGCQILVTHAEVNNKWVTVAQLPTPANPNAVPINSGAAKLKPMYFASSESLKRDGDKLIKDKFYDPAMFGDANAQYQLGREYATGANGLPVDLVCARTWLSWAANNGNTEALILLKTLLPKKP